MLFLKDSAVFKIQLEMRSIMLLLFVLLPLLTAKFHISNGADFNVSVHPQKGISVKCRNTHDWIGFLTENGLDLKLIDRLTLSGCELPKAEYVDRPFDDGGVKFLKVDGLKGRVSKQGLNTFTGLKVLVLSNNCLGQVDADLLYDQYNLTTLDLSATQIRIPPQFFDKSKSLTHLDLSKNNLRNLEPGVFDGLENLRTLNLSHNNFDSLQPKLFRGLLSLGFLDLSTNRIFEMPNDTFRGIVNLTFVDLSGNRFIGISENLFFHGLNKLKFVRLTHNKLDMTELPSKLFSNSSSLKVLSLVGLNMRQLSEDQFRGLVNVVELNMSENKLEELPADLLRDTGELRKFDVSANKLQALPDGLFNRSRKLMQLDLSKNHITTFGTHFSDLHRYALLEVNLQDNELEYLHSKAFSSLRHLKIAKLSRNRMAFRSSISKALRPLHHCSNLEELDVSGNEIDEMLADWVRNLDELRKLNLSANEISYFGVDDLEFASKRLHMDLSHNNIGVIDLSLPKLRNHSREITINLNENPIDCYCDVYPLQQYAANVSAFERVRLLIDNVTCNDPPSLRSLRLSELNDAKLECTSSNGRSKLCASEGACDCRILPANRTLLIDCARRNLTQAPSWIRAWDDLHVSLDLSGNALTRVPRMISNGYDKVESLNLADNRIESIDESIVSNNLRHLHLERNRLTAIESFIKVKLVTNLQSLWLADNPWVCHPTHQYTQFLEHFDMDVVADYNDLKCYNPPVYISFFSNLGKLEISWDEKIVEEIVAYVIFIFTFLVCLILVAIQI